MKKILYLTLVSASLVLLNTSCGGPKKMEATEDSQEVILPLSGKEFQSDKEFYRAKSSGKSPDIATAKKIALNNAKAEVAGLISSKIKNCY